MEQEFFDILVENGTNERLDKIAMSNEVYMRISKELDDAVLEKEKMVEKLQEIDRKISTLYGNLMASYTKVAYEQGFKDMVEILTKSRPSVPKGRHTQ